MLRLRRLSAQRIPLLDAAVVVNQQDCPCCHASGAFRAERRPTHSRLLRSVLSCREKCMAVEVLLQCLVLSGMKLIGHLQYLVDSIRVRH